MRASRLLLAATLVIFLSPPPALAGGADGAWECKIDDGGKAFGSLGLEGNSYIFANPNGQSGKGGIAYQDGADAPTFVVLSGVLVSEVGTLGGWLDASIPAEPALTLIDALGNRVLCQPRREQK
jgi:hypothetical protein